MPPRWILAAGLSAALLSGAPTPAAAALCASVGPHLASPPQLPLGCPVHVFAAPRPDLGEPALFALRGGSYVPVTGSRELMDQLVLVEETLLDCDLSVVDRVKTQHPFTHYTLTPSNVQVGEQIGVGEGWLAGIELTAAGPCPAVRVPEPACTAAPTCSSPFPPFEEGFSSDGCAAGGGAGLAVALALVLRRRRRR